MTESTSCRLPGESSPSRAVDQQPIISEKRKSRARTADCYLNYCHRKCRPAQQNHKCHELAPFASLAFVLIAALEFADATSQINSIWVARDADVASALSHRSGALQKGPENKTMASPTEQQVGPAMKLNLKDTFLELKQQLLQASASSLQPAIVAAEPNDEESARLGGRRTQRRSDQQTVGERAPRFKVAHISSNFSDAATSLDHLWSGSAPSLSNQTLSNAQVQFDEDQHHHTRHQPDKHQLGPGRFNRRQDNETFLSQLAPTHEDYQPSLLAEPEARPREIQFDERRARNSSANSDSNFVDDLADSLLDSNATKSDGAQSHGNRTFAPLASHEIRPHGESSATHSRPPPSGIYYLPDGDRWNTITFDNKLATESMHSERERPTASIEPKRRNLHPLEQNSRFSLNGRPADQLGAFKTPRLSSNNRGQHEDLPLDRDDESQTAELSRFEGELSQVRAPRPRNTWEGQLPQTSVDFAWPRPLSSAPNYGGFVPNAPISTTNSAFQTADRLNFAPETTRPPARFTPPATQQQLDGHLASSLAAHLGQRGPPNSLGLGLVPVGNLVHAAPQINRRARPQGANRVRTHFIDLGETPTPSPLHALTTKSFLRNYSPMQLLTGSNYNQTPSYKSRKSILSALNDKISNWTGEQSPNVGKYLESSFYESSPYKSVATAAHAPTARLRPAFGVPAGGLARPNFRPGALVMPPPHMFYGTLVQQPTVAPASNSPGRFYGSEQLARGHKLAASRARPLATRPGGGRIEQLSSRQAASFIPVVAVQVTRTSPAPLGQSAGQSADSMASNSLNDEQYLDPSGPASQQAAANEIDDYLASKTSQRQSSNQVGVSVSNLNERQKWDDTAAFLLNSGSLSSSPVARKGSSAGRPRQRAHAARPRGGGQETTVKSAAVFGYLPHQADTPLLQAINLFNQQLPPHQPASQAYNSANPSNELYGAQLDRAHQSVGAATPPLEHDSLGQLPVGWQSAVEDTPSLALQLQANSYAQNDIAHPFSGQSGQLFGGNSFPVGGHKFDASSASRAQLIRPLDEYSSEQSGQPNQLDFLAPSLSHLAAQAYQDQLAQLVANPLIGGGGNEQRNSATASSVQRQILAAGSSPLPTADELLSPAFFYQTAANAQGPSLESFYELMKMPAPPSDSSQGQGASTAASGSQDSEGASSEFSASSSASGETERGHSTAAQNKGKKRSSEFFANAGQLLLSALPLLLAPTLGLMFASSHNPIARLHGANPLASAAVQAATHVSPGHYLPGPVDQLSDGLVMNASPVPQLFTPTPLVSHAQQSSDLSEGMSSSSANKNSKFDASLTAANSSRPSPPPPPPPPPPPNKANGGSQQPTSRHKSTNVTASLPALTGLKMDAATSKAPKLGVHKSGTTPKPLTLILTSSGPGANLAGANSYGNFTLVDLNSSASIGDLNFERPRNGSISSPTVLVFEAHEDQDDNSTNSIVRAQANDTYQLLFEGEQQNSGKFANFTTTSSTTKAPAVMYDIGYEGADFDAHFATLKRVTSSEPDSSQRQQATHQSLTTLGPHKYVKDKSHYQYADVNSDSTPASSNRTPPQVPADQLEEDTRLFPVSTWPPMRRRTVSLITSNGNKTLPDSSERYTAAAHVQVDRRTSDVHRRTNSDRTSQWASPSQGRQPDSKDETVQGNARSQNSQVLRPNSTRVELNSRSRVDDERQSAKQLHGSTSLDSFLVDVARESEPVTRGNLRTVASRRRKRREIGANAQEESASPATKTTARPAASERRVRLVKRRLRVKKVASSEPASSASGLELERVAANNLLEPRPSSETLNGDASKSKSAIVTAMITHVGNDATDANDANDELDSLPLRNNSFERIVKASGGRSASEHEIELMRDKLLAKKLFLDRLATRASSEPDFRSINNDNYADKFSSGGRGRGFRPIPVSQEGENDSPRPVESDSPRDPKRRRSNSLELNEDTKQALAEFGTLLLEDTLTISENNRTRPALGPRRRGIFSNGAAQNRSRHHSAHEENESDSSSATERYAVRATPAPPGSGQHPAEAWSRFYEANTTHRNYGNESQMYRPPGRHQLDRDQVGLRTSSDHTYQTERPLPPRDSEYSMTANGGGEPPAQSRYNDFLQSNLRPNRTDSNSTSDQLDARYSTYANYSASATSNPSKSEAHHLDRYAAERDHHSGASRRDTLPADHYGATRHDHYNDDHHQRTQNYYSNYSSYAPPPRHPHYRHQQSYLPQQRLPLPVEDPYSVPPPPGHYYRAQPRLPAASEPYQPSQWPSKGGADQLPTGPSHPTHYPAPSHSPDSTGPSEDYPLPYGPSSHNFGPDPAHPHYRPYPHQAHSTPTYAPSSSSHQMHHHNQHVGQHSRGPGGAHEAASSSYDQTVGKASDTKAVNEYLKRVQFSDSDRDKLMASYLTCDGLLNDNDHCLERLSCEFSDPQNIEKANKLDRAVSSILLGHILINTYIPDSFKLRLKSASLFGYTQSGKCSKFSCSKLARAATQMD